MTDGRTLGEFERIATYFAPLAAPEALGLTDDAALLDPAPGCSMVLTTDTMVAGVHFLADDPPDLIARKLMRVNLSDLAAMGARPRGYLLASSWRRDTTDDWIAAFARGLAADQAMFDVGLLGGDTTSTDGPITLTITAVGEVEKGKALRRNGARPDDEVWLTGTIGDAGLGLRIRKGESLGLSAEDNRFLLDRHLLPTPRLDLGRALVGQASAAIDVSDGLLADLGHICETSGLGARIDAKALPLSPPARRVVAMDRTDAAALASSGDDYELCFVLPPGATPAFPAQRIGKMTSTRAVELVDESGNPLRVGRTGYRHF